MNLHPEKNSVGTPNLLQPPVVRHVAGENFFLPLPHSVPDSAYLSESGIQSPREYPGRNKDNA
jgi:hypothetical protein